MSAESFPRSEDMVTRRTLLMTGLALVCTAVSAPGDAGPPDVGEARPLDAVTMTGTEIRLPGVTIDRETREVRIDAVACLDAGILEYVVCRPNTFEHEAIFTTDARPELVHAALLLAGLTPTPQLRGLTGIWYDKAMQQEASRVRIEVEWKEGAAVTRVPLSSMLRNRGGLQNTPAGEAPAGGKALVRDAWVFAGSFLNTHPRSGRRFYAANASGILVGIWPDPSAVIQYGLPNGNPYEGMDLGMEINEGRIPKLHTKVQLIFSRLVPLEDNPLKSRKAPERTGN